MPRIFTTIGAGSFTTVAADGDRAFFSMLVALHLSILIIVELQAGPRHRYTKPGSVFIKTADPQYLLPLIIDGLRGITNEHRT
jgi:hypothetical protein